jgi:hypothetical protein
MLNKSFNSTLLMTVAFFILTGHRTYCFKSICDSDLVHSNVLPVSMVLFSDIKEQTSLQDYAQYLNNLYK